MTDYYQILGVKKTATTTEIHSAFRRLAKATHPDLNKNNPKKVEQFTQIKQAYDTLSNSEKRQKYDISLNPPKKEAPKQHPASPNRPSPRGYTTVYRTVRKRSYIRLLFRYHLFSTCVMIGIYIVLKHLFHHHLTRLFQIILIYKALWLFTLILITFYRRYILHKKY